MICKKDIWLDLIIKSQDMSFFFIQYQQVAYKMSCYGLYVVIFSSFTNNEVWNKLCQQNVKRLHNRLEVEGMLYKGISNSYLVVNISELRVDLNIISLCQHLRHKICRIMHQQRWCETKSKVMTYRLKKFDESHEAEDWVRRRKLRNKEIQSKSFSGNI